MNEELTNMFDISGYLFIHRSRKDGKGGGVGAYISDRLVWERQRDIEHESIESIWFEIKLNLSKGFLVGVIYRPPDSSKYVDKILILICLNVR